MEDEGQNVTGVPVDNSSRSNTQFRNDEVRSSGGAMTAAERVRLMRQRRRELAQRGRGSSRQPAMTSTERTNRLRLSTTRERESVEVTLTPIVRPPEYFRRWELATMRFRSTFIFNEFGHKCNVCDRSWLQKDLKPASTAIARRLREHFPEENVNEFKICRTCYAALKRGSLPNMSRSNGYRYPMFPAHLPRLNPVEERLVSPRLPYMQVRRLRHAGQYGIVGQVINIPVDVNNMVKTLPRQLDDDYAINVNIKRALIHKSSYLSGFVRKGVIKAWLKYLVGKPLYRQYNINIDWDELEQNSENEADDENIRDRVENLLGGGIQESELCYAQQHTMLWNESKCLDIAPGQLQKPLNIIFDLHAEELSFPMIYLGEARIIAEGAMSTPYTMSTSEIRRSDRRGAKPNHILYIAMCMLRRRVTDGIHNTFRLNRVTENITRKQIEDREFVKQMIEVDTAFMKTVPNSVQYWSSRKRDVFSMIRQLGKLTGFMTLSASEANWPHLLRTLHRWNPEWHNEFGPELSEADIMERMRSFHRHHLVSEDPVIWCVYFYRMVVCILTILSSTRNYNPFGKYRILDYFLRIEFQHRGSPHAHILVWLANDPREPVSENMPLTTQMLTELCSVDKEDLPDENLVSNQTHSHTFTCFKRGEQSCRFGIPFWPMRETRILLPMTKDDNRRKLLKNKVNNAREKLSSKQYESIDAYIADIGVSSYNDYLDLIRSTLSRPVVCFKRRIDQILINTFNPWIAGTLKSNMDLQLVLDPYSCAAYVVDYVNKSNRGISHFHRQLVELHESNPQDDYVTLMKSLALKMLNSAEMSAQEAAWFLLRQPMSWASRKTVVIPTTMPHERQRSRKRRSTMDKEGIGMDSTNIWTKNIIEKYEERPDNLENVILAQFAAWYDIRRSNEEANNDDELSQNPDDDIRNLNLDDDIVNLNDDDRNIQPGNQELRQQGEGHFETKRRKICRVIRYRNYDAANDFDQFKREQVLLHIPFRNEHTKIMDCNRFLQIYDERERDIVNARKEFEFDADINEIMAMIAELRAADQEPTIDHADDALGGAHIERILENNDDDFQIINPGISAVRDRGAIMTKQRYCEVMRNTNHEQRELILEAIHRIHLPQDRSEPIQIFFTGPAGSGKTYTMKLLMETYNRFTVSKDGRPPQRNAYIACASTGKAATAIDGVTVHSAFRLTLSRQHHDLSAEILQPYRHLMREVRAVVLDEVSMCSAQIFANVNKRLQQITGSYDLPFGGLDFIATGDLYQLPPVNASPVYKPLRGVLGGAILWQSLQYFPLTKVMRQTNERFSTILTKIGAGCQLEPDEIQLIESRFRTREWCDENLPGVVRLFFNNADVEDFNRRAVPNIEGVTLEYFCRDSYIGNSTEAELRDARSKVHRMRLAETGNLPFVVVLTPGCSYMITINVDVEDRLVNGAIGTLRYIERVPILQPWGEDNNGEMSTRLWFEFKSPNVGRNVRIKSRPYVQTHANVLCEDWVPIIRRSCNFHITKKIRCKREQFPVVSACAMTIHKAQGGTFDRIVYDYNKKHPQPLVYVAVSRVTSIDGFFFTNANNDKTFYHGRGNTSPTIKETRDEYTRLSNHRLETVATNVCHFIETSKNSPGTCIMVNINVQSLRAHTFDLSTDDLIRRADLLNITETWTTSNDDIVGIDGFDIVCRYDCPKQRAGGVSVYKKSDTTYGAIAREMVITADHKRLLNASGHIGDIAAAEITLPGGFGFVLCTVYIHPKQTFGKVATFFTALLFQNSNIMEMINIKEEGKIHVPLVVSGDFNLSPDDRNRLCDFFRTHYNLQLINDVTQSTTLTNTCLDLTFARGMDAICKPYVSYFSHHYPVFNAISKRFENMKVRGTEAHEDNAIAGPSNIHSSHIQNIEDEAIAGASNMQSRKPIRRQHTSPHGEDSNKRPRKK